MRPDVSGRARGARSERACSSRIYGYTQGMAKVLLSMDERLLRRIDHAAKALGLSRSAYLARLATKELRGEKGPGASKEARDAMRWIETLVQEHGAEGEDSSHVIRAMRDAR